MTTRYVVAFDDSSAARRALDHAIARSTGGAAEIVVAHVLEWSPYSFLTAEELEERHKRRNEELQRAQEAIAAPVLTELEGHGIKAVAEIRYGHVAETLVTIASETGASQIIIGRTGSSGVVTRLFGSVAGTLAQISPVPVTIVP